MKKILNEPTFHHYMAIEMNIQTWNILQKNERDKKDDTRMINFAKASLFHWRNSPKYQPINEQRGQWLLSHVFAVLGDGEQAITYAEEAFRLTMEKQFVDFDLAYALEAMARAKAALGDKEGSLEWRKKSKDASSLIKDEKDRDHFDSDFESGPWFGVST
jgi:hypothetical protein